MTIRAETAHEWHATTMSATESTRSIIFNLLLTAEDAMVNSGVDWLEGSAGVPGLEIVGSSLRLSYRNPQRETLLDLDPIDLSSLT